MRRDTLAFSLAGVVFGFLLGYMTANWSSMPPPVAVPAGQAAPAEPDREAPAHHPDPEELRAAEQLALQQPDDAALRVRLGNLHMDAHHWDEAIRWYGEALRLLGDDPDVRTDLGACYVHSGRAAEGLAEFDAVLAKAPGHRNARFNRGVALLGLGRQAEAADTWEELLRRFPADPQLGALRSRIGELRATLDTKAEAATGR